VTLLVGKELQTLCRCWHRNFFYRPPW